METTKLARTEEYILDLFRRSKASRLLATLIFDSSPEYANADLVRALEDLEKRWRLVIRHTDEGNDWVSLTPEGAASLGLPEPPRSPVAYPHPPRSSTPS